jgi:Mg2+ and Co2+ transporter CorA
MAEAGTKQAFKNVFDASKVHMSYVEERLIKRIDALEKSVKELRDLYESRLMRMKVDHKKQSDTVERNEKMLMDVITVQQKQLENLTHQNKALMDSHNDMMMLIEDVSNRYMRTVGMLEKRIEYLED